MNRPDFSDLVVHFTSNRKPYAAKKHAGKPDIARITGTAYDKLVSILTSKSIWATPQNWTDAKAACFTECPWGSLVHHAAVYSPFGLGFRKETLFAAGGGPAIYLRPDLFDRQLEHLAVPATPTSAKKTGFHPDMYAFVTPFVPRYAAAAARGRFPSDKHVDFTHEREWRVPKDFAFDLKQVEFVVVETYEDMAKFPRPLKDAIGRKKFIILETYRTIERLWPVHLMPDGE